jgi:hypothetical protein
MADLPTTNNTTIATFADDTALLATNSDPALAFQQLRYQLDLLQEWCDKWKIKINQTKSPQITFTTKCMNCPPVTINNIQIPVQKQVKYLGLYLDQKLTWQKHIKTKHQHLTKNKKKPPWPLVRERTIPTERPPLVDEI